jgi:DNA-binding FadR family transcriptional regulator
MPLQTVEPQRLYRQIAGQLRALICQGEFAIGARLPAERDLAKQLGVSRPSVREALIALEVDGWVEVRTGSGVYVLDRDASGRQAPVMQVAANEWGPMELIQARRVVEGETAALAAIQAKRKHIDAMGKAMTHMRADADRGVLSRDDDRAFHFAIVESSGNTVLIETVQRFWDSRMSPLYERLGEHFDTVESWREAVQEHEAIYTAVRTRDADAARTAMHVHMDNAHERFNLSWRRTKARKTSKM